MTLPPVSLLVACTRAESGLEVHRCARGEDLGAVTEGVGTEGDSLGAFKSGVEFDFDGIEACTEDNIFHDACAPDLETLCLTVALGDVRAEEGFEVGGTGPPTTIGMDSNGLSGSDHAEPRDLRKPFALGVKGGFEDGRVN